MIGAEVCLLLVFPSVLFLIITGVPVAWMVSSDGKEETIYLFLTVFHSRNPVVPRYILSDRDEAQLSAIRRVYKSSHLFLCLWHVLHAWRAHLRTSQYPDVWAALQQLPRADSKDAFDRIWNTIKRQAPADFVSYLQKYWMSGK